MKIAGIDTRPPPPAEKRNTLEAILPAEIPADYLTFFERYDGAEIWFDDVDWENDSYDCLRLDSIDEMLDPETRAALADVFSDLFVIGSDAGGQVLAYDMTRPHPWPIVMHLPGSSEAGKRLVVAPSMTELMRTYLKTSQ